jgi:predicted negative regulator of RcsB-dependent stress response
VVLNPYRERQALRWQESERRRAAVKEDGFRTPLRRMTRIWLLTKLSWKAIIAGSLGLITAAFSVGVAALLVQLLFEQGTIIQPLSVPKSMAEAGFTPDVAAVRLRDAVGDVFLLGRTSVLRLLTTSRENPVLVAATVMASSDTQDFVVPTIGVSVQALAAQLRQLLNIHNRRSITGEFTIKNGLLVLNLRMDGVAFFATTNGVDRERPADLLGDAARAILGKEDPFTFAVLNAGADKDRLLAFTESLMVSSPDESWEGRFARSLRANLLSDLGRRDEAIAEYKTAIRLDPQDASAHANLGNVLSDLKRSDEALAEYKTAIRLDPQDAGAHANLGNVLSDLGRRDEAMAEYKTAIMLDPKLAASHIGLGNVLNALGRREEAMSEYRAAEALSQEKISSPPSRN